MRKTSEMDDVHSLQLALDEKRGVLEGVVKKPDAKEWLEPCAASVEGTAMILEELEKSIDGESFLKLLDEEKKHRERTHSTGSMQGDEVTRAEWWDCDDGRNDVGGEMAFYDNNGVHDGNEVHGGNEVPSSIAEPEYVVVHHEDVILAMAEFLAAYIVTLPESRNMNPEQLQGAVQQALKEMRKGTLQKAWEWGRLVYRTAAFGYGAFAVYTNPWVAIAIMKSLFTCIRFAVWS